MSNPDDHTGRLDTTVGQILAVIDAEIAADRKLYLECYFRGHDTEARMHAFDVDELINLRNVIEREVQR